MNWENTSVLILSKDSKFSDSLIDHLADKHLSERLFIGSYEDVDDCLQHLSSDDKNDVIVFNYDNTLATELNKKNQDLLKDFTLIHYVPENMDRSEVKFVNSGVNEYAVAGAKPYSKITRLIKRASRRGQIAKGFANANYWIAGLALLVILSAVIYLTINY